MSNEALIYYTDAGTKKNGQIGFQETVVVVTDLAGKVVFIKEIGDYSNNEGEILGVIAALKNMSAGKEKKIFCDSSIAVN